MMPPAPATSFSAGALNVKSAVAAERERILTALSDGIVKINPDAIVTWPNGNVANKSECDRSLFDLFKQIVRGE